MKRRFLPLLLGLVATTALASCATASPDDGALAGAGISLPPDSRVVATLRLAAYGPQLEELTRRDYDVAGVDVATSEVDLVIAPEEVDRLRDEGFAVVNVAPVGSVAPDPDLAKYFRHETVASALKAYAERFPAIAEQVSIGRSTQGRDIFAIRITKDAAAGRQGKPAILFNGMHHARELMTTEVAMDTVQYLLERYGTDEKVTHWIDVNEIWVVPMLNVDGSNQVWTSDTFWRKNTRGCATSGACPRGTGVDINRNYPYRFAACNGSSASASSDSYRGPSAGSEPETQAMMRLIERTRPVFDLSYHSYSELVLYPYGCTGQQADVKPILQDIGGKMGRALPTDDGARTYKAGTPWEILYGVDGDDMDWMLQDFAVVPFAIEVGGRSQGFRPAYGTWRDRTVTKLRAAWQLLLDRLDGSGVRGVVHDGSGEALAGSRVTVSSSSAAIATQTRPVNPDGSFHVVLLPGQYTVRVESAGRASYETTVTVGERRVDLDVVLD